MKNISKRPEGRPPTWTNKEVVQKIIEEYFKHEKQPTMSGLAAALDMSRQNLYNYAIKDEFFDTIKKARERIEEIYENLLIYSERPTGVIFALKNTGWKDRTDMTTNDKDIPSPIYNGKSTKE